MHVQTDPASRGPSLDAVEAANAMLAEDFGKLPDEIELWRFREVLTKLGTELGLSGGAVVYAIDLMGLLTEADWRGDGRAVTFQSIRSYARKVGKAERTICGYENQLVRAGLAHRTVKHARRHGGAGSDARRTGLDWRAFGARMPDLLQRLDRRRAEEERRLDVEARIRRERRVVLGLLDAVMAAKGQGATTAFLARYAQANVGRLRGTLPVPVLEARLLALTLLRDDLAAAVEPTEVAATVPDAAFSSQTTDQSADLSGHKDITKTPSCPSDIRCDRPKGRTGLEAKPSSGEAGTGWSGEGQGGRTERRDALPALDEIWKAAPDHWRAALGSEVPISWPVLIDLARHFLPELGVSAYAWHKALRVLGPSEAALALVVLDRNRDHPVRPVRSVGGALVGMVRRAEEGAFNLAPSVYGLLARAHPNARKRGQGRAV